MNLVPLAPLWLLGVLIAAMAAAALEDAIRLRISNITSLAVLISALVAMGLQGFAFELWQNAVVCLVLLAVGTPLFAAGKMGGGDVKLFAALGLWVNFSGAISLIAAVFIAGGILALGFLASRLLPSRRERAGIKSRQIPYGIAIVAGAALVFAGQMGLMKAKPHLPPKFVVHPTR